jgi:hypothetical protein
MTVKNTLTFMLGLIIALLNVHCVKLFMVIILIPL